MHVIHFTKVWTACHYREMQIMAGSAVIMYLLIAPTTDTTPYPLQVSIKEGYLMKQMSSFQRWKKRYFKLKGHKLYYAKDTTVGTELIHILPLPAVHTFCLFLHLVIF